MNPTTCRIETFFAGEGLLDMIHRGQTTWDRAAHEGYALPPEPAAPAPPSPPPPPAEPGLAPCQTCGRSTANRGRECDPCWRRRNRYTQPRPGYQRKRRTATAKDIAPGLLPERDAAIAAHTARVQADLDRLQIRRRN